MRAWRSLSRVMHQVRNCRNFPIHSIPLHTLDDWDIAMDAMEDMYEQDEKAHTRWYRTETVLLYDSLLQIINARSVIADLFEEKFVT